ncbi:uncharacterized protein LOC127876607 isoform X3 [Dreissena polymorpha]|uniref:uncharacterized protein LOC127876607 isoform X3 n=1 Tax=Dreissena polymorpha TaxID=45954 RepID=UPI002263B6E5|nr:uncharacterized protein LOC127876607 isoform X3 [Dreissena polymorpha]
MSGDSLSLMSGTSGLTIRGRNNFCEGWVEHKEHTHSGVRYKKLWMLLEDNIIYIFSDNKPCSTNQIGNLTIDSRSTFKYLGPANDKSGYKFDLFAGKRLNRFKTRLRSELELWRGYIVGLSRGAVPKDLDLLPDQVSRIEEDVTLFHVGATRGGKYSPPSLGGDSGVIPDVSSLAGKHSVFSGGLGPDGVSVRTGVTGRSPGSRSGSGGSGETNSISGGGPTMVHRFYPDRFADQTPPSWFVKRCSRETAENVLRNADRLGYGNTLMRESTSHINNGSYVISKLIRDKRTGVVTFEHYEVIRVAGGYKVHVENEHNPMICLDDVMKYFHQTCGGGTLPLKTNDFRSLQLDASEPNYATKFPRRPLSMATQETGLAEPEPDYDRPAFRQPEHFNTYRGPPRDNPVDLRGIGTKYPRGVRHSVPSFDEMRLRHLEQETVQELDKAIEGAFQRDMDYVNVPTENLPPPKPHMQKSFSTGTTASYVNEDPETLHLPVAPPAPRHPIGSPASSGTKPLRSSQSFNTPPHSSTQKFVTTNMSTLQQNLASVTLRKTPSNQLQQNEEAQPRSIVSKSSAITSPRSPNSPSNFPQWNTQKKSPMSEKPDGSSSSAASSSENGSGSGTTSTGSHSTATSDSGVDVRKPGGVGTLLRKFEVKPETSGSPTVTKKVPQRSKLGDGLWAPITEQEYEQPDSNISTHDPYYSNKLTVDEGNTNRAITKGAKVTYSSQNRAFYGNSVEDVYDDTANPDPYRSEKRVQFETTRHNSVDASASEENTAFNTARNRRQSEPSVNASDKIHSKFEEYPNVTCGRLSVEFKNQLENLMKGATMPSMPKQRPSAQVLSPSTPQTPSSGQPRSRFDMPLPPVPKDSRDDHVYEPLPDIPPDDVTYYNDVGR